MNDDDFARTLRDRADAVVPPLEVSTHRVIPRARRRRAVVRSVGTVAASTVLLGAAWAASGVAGPVTTLAPPATTVTMPAPSSPVPRTPAPTTTPDDAAATSAEDDATGRWWFTHTRVSLDGTVTEERRTWESREHPGLVVLADSGEAFAMGPVNVLGRFYLDGAWVDRLRDPGLLPTDPDELEKVLRASVEPDRRSGTDEDKVFGMVRDLLWDHGLVPEDLRRAAWTVADRLPGSTVVDGTDDLGRAGQVLDRAGEDGVHHLVLDPASALLLQDAWTVVVESRVADGDELPMEPTLELAGCVAWETC